MNNIDRDYIVRKYHLDWGEGWRRSPRYGLPVLDGESYVPDKLVLFEKINTATDRNACVVFNQPDRRIDRVWNSPERYFPLLRQFACVTTPDFSLLLDMERQFIEYNLLRSLKMGRRMQELGMRVIVNAMWAFPDTYDICFEALPRNSVLFVSTVGSVLRRLARDYFKRGMKAMLERVRPSGIVLYGPVPPMDFAVPVLRHFDRLSPVRRGAYQPDLDLRGEGV